MGATRRAGDRRGHLRVRRDRVVGSRGARGPSLDRASDLLERGGVLPAAPQHGRDGAGPARAALRAHRRGGRRGGRERRGDPRPRRARRRRRVGGADARAARRLAPRRVAADHDADAPGRVAHLRSVPPARYGAALRRQRRGARAAGASRDAHAVRARRRARHSDGHPGSGSLRGLLAEPVAARDRVRADRRVAAPGSRLSAPAAAALARRVRRSRRSTAARRCSSRSTSTRSSTTPRCSRSRRAGCWSRSGSASAPSS